MQKDLRVLVIYLLEGGGFYFIGNIWDYSIKSKYSEKLSPDIYTDFEKFSSSIYRYAEADGYNLDSISVRTDLADVNLKPSFIHDYGLSCFKTTITMGISHPHLIYNYDYFCIVNAGAHDICLDIKGKQTRSIPSNNMLTLTGLDLVERDITINELARELYLCPREILFKVCKDAGIPDTDTDKVFDFSRITTNNFSFTFDTPSMTQALIKIKGDAVSYYNAEQDKKEKSWNEAIAYVSLTMKQAGKSDLEVEKVISELKCTKIKK